MLTNASIGVGCPGDAVLGDLTVCSNRLTFEHHAFTAKAAVEKKQRTGSIDPGLMPDLSCGIEHIEALAAVAVAGGVALMHHAPAVLARDGVDAGEFSIG